jgi:hypothetical protein
MHWRSQWHPMFTHWRSQWHTASTSYEKSHAKHSAP